MKQILYVCLAVLMLLSFNCPAIADSSSDSQKLIVYPEYDARIPRCYDYGVTVHQQEKSEKLTVYNRNANGEQMSNRCFKPDFDRRFCEFAFTGEVRIDIEVYKDFTSYSILPTAKAYRNEYHDGIISVWLDQNNTNFMLRLDDDDSSILSVFADAPEDYSYDPNDSSVLYVNQKWYVPNSKKPVYDVPSTIKTIYIAPGCVLCSRLLINTDNVTVCGHGMLVDPLGDYYDTRNIDFDNSKMVIQVKGSNITIKDIKMIDTQNWNIYLFDGYNHTIDGVKILTARITTDAVAVGSGNVTIKNCVFYVSDNVFTYNGDRGTHNITNCLIGTTCAAFFPQHQSLYDINFKDIYVFRANEGIVNNWYNPARHQSQIKHITFENLDCTDVVNTPWIFSAYDMGDATKYFTFRNCCFANIRGDSNIASWNQKAGQAVYVTNNTSYMHCSGYKIELFDCTLDGKTITDASMLNPQMAKGDIDFVISNKSVKDKKRQTKVTVNHVYPKKVYVGNYLLPLCSRPLEIDGGLFIPEREMCKCLGVKVVAKTEGTTVDGIKYISIDTINKYYTKAVYDTGKKAVIINAISDLKKNLVEDYSYTSRWNPYAYPNVILGPYVDSDGSVVLRCDVNSNSLYPGMFTEITNDLKMTGAGKYTVSFDAKSVDGKSYAGRIRIHNICYDGYKEIDRTADQTFEADKDWKHFSIELDLSKWNTSDAYLSFIRICSDNTPGYDVVFKNIKMIKNGTTREPDYEEWTDSFNVADAVIKLDKSSLEYTGKSLKPKFTVKLGQTTLKKNVDYNVTYKNNKNVGVGTIKISGIGQYTGTKEKTFTITPTKPSIKSITSKKGKVTVKWSIKAKQNVSYKLQYSTKKSFATYKTVTVKSGKKLSAVLKGLKKGKTYYIRVCAYKKVNGRTIKGKWSPKRKITAK